MLSVRTVCHLSMFANVYTCNSVFDFMLTYVGINYYVYYMLTYLHFQCCNYSYFQVYHLFLFGRLLLSSVIII